MDAFFKDIKKATTEATEDASTELPRTGVISSPFGEVDFSKDRDQAEKIWAMLNSMAESDPEAYARYIRQNYEEGMAEKTGREQVTPDPGLCFKANVSAFVPIERPDDSFGIEANGRIHLFPTVPEDVKPGQTLYVNLCTHARMGPPKTLEGKAVTEPLAPGAAPKKYGAWKIEELGNLEIPMAIGSVRPVRGTGEWCGCSDTRSGNPM